MHSYFESQHHLIAVKGGKNEFEQNLDDAVFGETPDIKDPDYATKLTAYMRGSDVDTTSDIIHSAVGGIIGWQLIPDLYNESLRTAFVSEIKVNFGTLYADKEERHEADVDKMLIGQMACALGSRTPSLTFEVSKQSEERVLRPYREMIGRQSWPTTGRGVRQMGTYEPMPGGYERGDEEFMWMRGFWRASTLDLMAAAAIRTPRWRNNMDKLLSQYTLVYKVPAALSP